MIYILMRSFIEVSNSFCVWNDIIVPYSHRPVWSFLSKNSRWEQPCTRTHEEDNRKNKRVLRCHYRNLDLIVCNVNSLAKKFLNLIDQLNYRHQLTSSGRLLSYVPQIPDPTRIYCENERIKENVGQFNAGYFIIHHAWNVSIACKNCMTLKQLSQRMAKTTNRIHVYRARDW